MAVFDLVVVGGGQAAVQLLVSLHQLDYDGSVLLLGDERLLPYQRPPLSKQYLEGEYDEARLLLRPQSFYDRAGVRVALGESVCAIDRRRHRIETASGKSFGYRKLVLVTGARVRRLTVPGAGLEGVCYLRSLADARDIRDRLAQARGVAVVGGGFIGLEFASVARRQGVGVVVLEAQERLLARALVPRMSDYFAELHRRQGVDVRLGTQLLNIEGQDGRVAAVVTREGTRLPVGLVVAGIGVLPNQELAGDAGIECENGIAVDAFGRSSDADVFAAGDCASHPDARLGTRVRLESVQNATDQAAALAHTLVGRPHPYDAVPWFWSQQYDVRLQMAGLAVEPQVGALRGSPENDCFSLFHFSQGRLLSVDSVNSPADHSLARQLLSRGNSLTPEQAADTGFSLREALARPGTKH